MLSLVFFFFFTYPSTTLIYTLSLHDALPISKCKYFFYFFNLVGLCPRFLTVRLKPAKLTPSPVSLIILAKASRDNRSEEHTSELQSRRDLVCRLLLEKKKKKRQQIKK